MFKNVETIELKENGEPRRPRKRSRFLPLFFGFWIAGALFGAWLITRHTADDYPDGLGSNMSGTPYGNGSTVGGNP